ncbi:hypothetical protein VN23_01620 [Janthinobacterium sp. B9-8]|nr:hypothetical protein VN23_01620 [Janthinobacterium sp. B9-8]
MPQGQVLSNASQGVKILYTSTNGVDNKTPIYVSGDIQFPKGTPPAGGWPVIAWAHGTVGVADVCAPSWSGRSQRDIAYLDTWLNQGYAIVSSDYQGLGTPGLHPYLHSRPEAYSVLDAVRAAQRAFPQLSRSVVTVGQSQGGQAAVATAAYAPMYAPELNVLGTVATGVPYALHQIAPLLDSLVAKIPSTGFTSVIATLESYAWFSYATAELVLPDFLLSKQLTNKGKDFYSFAASKCLGDIENYIMQNKLTTADVFNSDVAIWTNQVLPRASYPTLKLNTPLFIGTGALDTSVPTAVQYLLAKDACTAGSVVEQHYYPGQGHSGAVTASLIDSIPFVQKLFSGQKIISNCSTLLPPSQR